MKNILYLVLILMLFAVLNPIKYASIAWTVISYANIFITDALFWILNASNYLKGNRI